MSLYSPPPFRDFEMPKRRVILSTLSGSHAWGMNRPESDEDVFHLYVAPTRAILEGTADTKVERIKTYGNDHSYYEVGHVVRYLLEGNLNFIVHVCSPAILTAGDWGLRLKKLVIAHPSKAIHHTAFHIAGGNYNRYLKSGGRGWVESGIDSKKVGQVARTLLFASHYLRTGEMRFAAPPTDIRAEDIPKLLADLDAAYAKSSLPERPPEAPFRDWLLQLRLHDLAVPTDGVITTPSSSQT